MTTISNIEAEDETDPFPVDELGERGFLNLAEPLTLLTELQHGAGTNVPRAKSFNEALQSEGPMWVPVDNSDPEGDARFVIADRHRSYGLWARRSVLEKQKDGKPIWRTSHQRITTWIAWQACVTETFVAGLTGDTELAGKSTATVKVYTQRGTIKTLKDLPDEDSDSLSRIASLVKAGIALPEGSRVLKEEANNALRTLGYDERTDSVAYACTGWINDDRAKNVFAAPSGSVDKDGPRDDITVVAPIGSSDGALTGSALGSIRVSHVATNPIDLAAAAASIKLTLEITPKRLDVAVAVVGATFSAPLMLATRGVVFLTGGPGCGKSLEATVVSGFQTGERPDKNRLPISIPKASRVGAVVITGWGRGLTIAADDWRIEGLSQSEERSSRGTLTSLVQGGYGAAEEAKGTQQGGLRAGRVSQATVLITGEIGPPDAAQTTRSVHLRVENGDIDVAGPSNGYDRWIKSAADGHPNMLFSTYIQWLAHRIDMLGGVTQLMAEAESVRRDWAAARTEERASETVASIAVGWHYLRAFLSEHRLDDTLPTEDEISEALDELVLSNVEVTEGSSLGARLVSGIGAMIQGGTGHLTDHSNSNPSEPSRWGWAVRSDISHPVDDANRPSYLGGGLKLGWISGMAHTPDTSRRATISVAGVKSAWREVTGGQQWSADTANRALAPYVDLGDSGSAKSKPCLPETFCRREGYVMTLETLGLEQDARANASQTTAVLTSTGVTPVDDVDIAA